MSNAEITYELAINAIKSNEDKENLIAFLLANGIDSFVEGSLDNLDLDNRLDDADFYSELGGALSPIQIFSFDENHLKGLKKSIGEHFSDKFELTILTQDTKLWQEGWKAGFLPIPTENFLILPPWLEKENTSSTLRKIIIEPKMAFGTGQHATTKLCIELLESWCKTQENMKSLKSLDVGCGSGILSIVLEKLGVGNVFGCDIEDDSVLASNENSAINNCKNMSFFKGSAKDFKKKGEIDLLVANIILPVLLLIMPDIAACVKAEKHIILSGLLKEQKEEILAKCKEYGMSLIKEVAQEGWIALLLVKNS